MPDPSPDPVTADDPGLLDRIEDVVDTVMADDLADAKREDPWERRQRLLDSWTAIILALAAVVTAWASFQASQWASVGADAQSASTVARTNAGRAATAATRARVIDAQV